MREPKVGEIWQWTANHKRGKEAYEFIREIEDGTVYTELVADPDTSKLAVATGSEEWDLDYFMRSHMYVW